MSIYKQLSNIQNELKAPKNQRNNFGNYNYRSAEDILEAGIYGGNPVRKIKDVDPEYILKRPRDYVDYEFDVELLRKYLPKWIGFVE